MRCCGDALEAWRVNPLGRRIVELTSQYVVGGGLAVASKHARTHKFLQEWWTHRLNRLEVRCFDWCDELTRSGELFIVLSTDLAGMSYVRAIPAADIQDIEVSENDVEQELIIWEKPKFDGLRPAWTGGDTCRQAVESLQRGKRPYQRRWQFRTGHAALLL
jgi:hypothetical protein